MKLTGDDAAVAAARAESGYNPVVAELPGGYRMIWERGAPKIHARQPYQFRFRLEDAAGQRRRPIWNCTWECSATRRSCKDDGSVFAHVHPSGSVPLAALGLAMPEQSACRCT